MINCHLFTQNINYHFLKSRGFKLENQFETVIERKNRQSKIMDN